MSNVTPKTVQPEITEEGLAMHIDSLRYRDEIVSTLRGREAKITALNSQLYLLKEADFESSVGIVQSFAQSRLAADSKLAEKSRQKTALRTQEQEKSEKKANKEITEILKKTA